MSKESFEKGFYKRAEEFGINSADAAFLMKQADLGNWFKNTATNLGDSARVGWHNMMDNPLVHGANAVGAAWGQNEGMNRGGILNPMNSVINPFNWGKMSDAYHASHQDSLKLQGDAYGQQYGHLLGQGDGQGASDAAKGGIGSTTQVDDRQYRMDYGNQLNNTRDNQQKAMDRAAQNQATDQQVNKQLNGFNPLPHQNNTYQADLPQMGMHPNSSNTPTTINPATAGIPMAGPQPQPGAQPHRPGGGLIPPITPPHNGGGLGPMPAPSPSGAAVPGFQAPTQQHAPRFDAQGRGQFGSIGADGVYRPD